MHIDPKSEICGLAAMQARHFIRRMRFNSVTATWTASILNIGNQAAIKFLGEMVRAKYVELDLASSENFGEPRYLRASKGRTLALASAARPVKRSTAEKKLDELLARVRILNKDRYYLWGVSQVLVFGSFLSNKERLSDLDIAVELSPKHDIETMIKKTNRRGAEASRRGRHLSQECYWNYSQYEVFRFLKKKSRTISLHPTEDPISLQAPTKEVFSIDPAKLLAGSTDCRKLKAA